METMPHPEMALLVYDGDCAFCQRSIDVGSRLLGPFRAEPYQFLDLAPLGLTEKQAEEKVWWVQPSVPPRGGHRAVAGLLRVQKRWWWRVLGQIIDRPPVSWGAAPVYAWISRNRHRLPGGSAQCRVPRAPRPDSPIR